MNTFDIEFNKNKKLYLYYIVLHLICISWTNIDMVQPPMILRLLITSAVFLPLIKYFWLAPAVVILFVGIRFNSIAPFGYIPQDWNAYCYLILCIAFLHNLIFKDKLFNLSNKQITIFFFVLIIETISLNFLGDLLLFILVLYVFYNSMKTHKSANISIFAFVLLSISLSLYYAFFADKFSFQNYGGDVMRSFWVDPNYFGHLLAIGAIFSFYFILNSSAIKYTQFLKFIFCACLLLSLSVIILQASRGALISLSASALIILLNSKLNIRYKISFCFILLLLLLYFAKEGFFDLLLERVEQDDGSGSGRSRIWNSKLTYFFDNPLLYIGSGFLSSFYKILPQGDCHNEFISTLFNYGIIGLVIFVIECVKLYFSKSSRVVLLRSFLLFSLCGFMTISPISCQTGWNGIPLLLPILYRISNLYKLK